MAFSGLAEVYRAATPPPSTRDPKVRDALDVLSATKAQGLGFFGRGHADAIDTAIRMLQEQGQAHSDEDRLKIVQALKDLDERRQLRLRVGIQIGITAMVILLAVAILLDWVKASDDFKKMAFGLIGTAVGYWLK